MALLERTLPELLVAQAQEALERLQGRSDSQVPLSRYLTLMARLGYDPAAASEVFDLLGYRVDADMNIDPRRR